MKDSLRIHLFLMKSIPKWSYTSPAHPNISTPRSNEVQQSRDMNVQSSSRLLEVRLGILYLHLNLKIRGRLSLTSTSSTRSRHGNFTARRESARSDVYGLPIIMKAVKIYNTEEMASPYICSLHSPRSLPSLLFYTAHSDDIDDISALHETVTSQHENHKPRRIGNMSSQPDLKHSTSVPTAAKTTPKQTSTANAQEYCFHACSEPHPDLLALQRTHPSISHLRLHCCSDQGHSRDCFRS
jgi:hypothetical protein